MLSWRQLMRGRTTQTSGTKGWLHALGVVTVLLRSTLVVVVVMVQQQQQRQQQQQQQMPPRCKRFALEWRMEKSISRRASLPYPAMSPPPPLALAVTAIPRCPFSISR
jgi:hypothetical protein